MKNLHFKKASIRRSNHFKSSQTENVIISDITLFKAIKIFKKKVFERTNNDIVILSKLLESTDLITLFKKEKIIDEPGIFNILLNLSYSLEYNFKIKNSIVFNIDDIGDKFYIILRGRVSILKPIKNQYNLTAFEYFSYLLNLKSNNHLVLINKTIKENLSVLPTTLSELTNIEIIIYKFKINRKMKILVHLSQKYYEDDYKVILDEFKTLLQSPINNFNHNIEFTDEIEDIVTQIKSFYLRFNKDNQEAFQKYSSLDVDIENKVSSCEFKYCLQIYEYENVITLRDNQFFGDSALIDKSRKRNATIMTETDCHFVTINQKIYNDILGQEKHKILHKQISYLNDLLIFQSLKRTMFDKKYFSHFILKEYSRYDVLCNEGSPIKNIYILKEGSLEIKLEKSIIELRKFINSLYNLEPRLEFVGLDYIKYKNYAEFKKKKNFLLFNLINKDCIGAEEFIYNIGHLTNAVVVSNKALIYSLDVKWIYSMMNSEKKVKYDFQNFALQKITVLYKRLIELDGLLFHNALKDTEIKFEADPKKTIDNPSCIEVVKKNLNCIEKIEPTDNLNDRGFKFRTIDHEWDSRKNINLERIPINYKNQSLFRNESCKNIKSSLKLSLPNINKKTRNKNLLVEEKILKKVTKSLNHTMLNIGDYCVNNQSTCFSSERATNKMSKKSTISDIK